MPQRCRKFLAVLLFMAAAFAAVQPAKAQAVVVTVKSIDQVMSDTRYLLTLAGQKDYADQIDGLLNVLTSGKGLAGIDTKRPLGLYVGIPEAGGTPPVVGFLPVTKEEELIDLLKQLNLEVAKEGEMHNVALPNGQSAYMHFANKYVYISNEKSSLKGKLPAEPAKLVPATAGKNSLISASARIDQLPKEYKDLFLQEITRNLEKEKEKKENESDAQYQARLAGMQMAKEALTSLVEDSREMALSFEVDQQQNRLALDFSLQPKPDTTLAAGIQRFGAAQSMFSRVVKDAALSLLVHLPLAKDVSDQFNKLIEQSVREALSKEENATRRALGEQFYKTIEPTLKSGVIDLGIALRGPLADKKYVAVGGLRIKEGKKVDEFLRSLVKDLPAKDRERVKLDHARHGDTAIHLLVNDENVNEDLQKHLGSQEIFVAIREDVIVFSIGQHGLTTIKETLDTLANMEAAHQTSAPVQFEAAVSRLAPLAKEEQEKIMEAVRKVFTGADKDKDKIRVSLQGGKALHLRLDADAQLVKLVVALSPLGAGQ